MTATRKGRWPRRLATALLAMCLLAGAALAALHFTGHSPAAMLRTYDLQRDARAIARQTDRQVRSATDNVARELGGAALAHTIRLSRNQARAERTLPIPDDIREQLEPHFTSIDFDQVRWKPATGSMNLGTILTTWYLTEGAVVLEDVIVFSSVRGTRDVRLWAHELTHVVQYQELGVDRFARTYVLGYAGLEQQAEDNALRVMAKLAGD
jgi:hypothetical protein